MIKNSKQYGKQQYGYQQNRSSVFGFRFGLNVAATHQIRSYRDSETNGNVKTQKWKLGGETTGRGQWQCELSLSYN